MNITYCYTRKEGDYNVLLYAKAIRRHAYCFKQKQKPPKGGSYCLGLDFGCYAAVRRFSIVFFKFANFPVDVDVIAELFQKFVDYAHTLHAFKI